MFFFGMIAAVCVDVVVINFAKKKKKKQMLKGYQYKGTTSACRQSQAVE